GQTLYDLARRLRNLVNRVRRHEKLWRGPKRDLFTAVGAPKAALDFDTAGAWAFSIPALAKARQIRIAGAGHPVEWGEKRGAPASTFIVQHTVSSRGCQLMLLYHGGKTEWQHVDLKALIEAQHETLAVQCRLAIAER